jgi:hypothetical protein
MLSQVKSFFLRFEPPHWKRGREQNKNFQEKLDWLERINIVDKPARNVLTEKFRGINDQNRREEFLKELTAIHKLISKEIDEQQQREIVKKSLAALGVTVGGAMAGAAKITFLALT